MKHTSWIFYSGLLWLGLGFFLLRKGLILLSSGEQESCLFCLFVGLLAGFIKGRYILSKTVRRVVLRIVSLPLPVDWRKVYGPSYLALLFSMMLLGVVLRFVPIPYDVKGTLDVAIGSALIHGSFLYFRLRLQYAKACRYL